MAGRVHRAVANLVMGASTPHNQVLIRQGRPQIVVLPIASTPSVEQFRDYFDAMALKIVAHTPGSIT